MNELPPGFVLDQTLPDGFVLDQKQPDILLDAAKGLGSGVVRGAAMLAGIGGDIAKLGTVTPEQRAGAVNAMPGWLQKFHEKPSTPIGSQEIMGAIDRATGLPVTSYEPQTTQGKYARTVGEFAPGLIGGPVGLGRRALTQVLAPGVASEAAGQITEGSKYEPYARVAGALAGGIAPSAIGRAVTPNPLNPARQRLVDVLADEGITSLTAGQRTGSDALRYAESSLGNAPFSGGRANAITRQGQEQFTEAAMRRAGAGPDAGPEVLAANQLRLGNEFRDLSARNTLNFDQQFGNDIGAAIRGYDRVPPSQQRAIVEGYVNDIIAHAQQGGTMPGPAYQEMRSRLSRQSNSLRNSDPTLSEALRDIRNALDNAMRRSISPADREAWDTARREYGAQKTIEKSVSRAGEATAEGQIVPANLRNTAAAENRSAYARGEGQFSELSRAGSAVMREMPQSGTAPRSMLYNLANIGTAGALPAAVGRALMSRPVQGYLGNQLATPALNNLNPRQAAIINALMAAQTQRLPRQ